MRPSHKRLHINSGFLRQCLTNRLKRFLLAAILSVVVGASASAQSVVVNKYFNAGTNLDIVELLVIQDNLDMRGMIIKDFSANMVNDGGGKFQFSTDALWSSLPAGTLIVLRNNNSAADVTVGGGDFSIDVGMLNATYFANAGGTFDIATTDLVMIKSAGSGAAGTTGSIHVLASGTAGAQFTAAPTPKLITTTTSGGNLFAFANNSTSSINDFNGTDATGGATGLTFGAGNNATNTTYINSLRNPGPASEPTVQASNVTFSLVGATSFNVNWTNGNGQSRIVLARQGAAVDGEPVDFTAYTANANFGSGSLINGGTAGLNYVVFAGSGNSVSITGLQPSTTYHFAVFESNGSGASTNYLTAAPATGSQATAAAFSISGNVHSPGGAGISGVVLTLASGDTPLANTPTDANGNYSFPSVSAGGDYTVTPSSTSFTFAPPLATFTSLAANQIANFTAQPRVVIDEFRFHGTDPDGGGPLTASANEFIELYNQTDENVSITGWTLRTSTGTVLLTIPAAAIPGRGHYLVGGTGYGLTSSAATDATFASDIPDGAGVALFNNSLTFDLSTRLDAVGFSGVADPVYREGTGLTPAGGVTTDGEISFVRRMPNGTPVDSDDNQADFLFVATDGGNYNSRQSTLGAPGTENASSPTSAGPLLLLDPAKPATLAPNRARDLTNSNPPNTANGRLSIRRTFVNTTGANITSLRFRIVDMTTLPASAGTADLRALTSGSVVVNVSGVDHTVFGTTLELPAQAAGGGINSTLTVGSVSLASPLANGAQLDLQFLLGVNNSEANFRFLVTAEVLTQAPLSANEHLTMGNPSNATTDVGVPANYLMEKLQYALSYNRDRGTPNWLSWHLDPTWLGSTPRQNDFREDTTLPAGWYQVLGTDYSGSGFDRGHHCPSGDRTSSVPTNSATFLMTNMMPQSHNNNTGQWNNLEIYSRDQVTAGNELYIIMGGSGTGGSGSNGGVTNTIANGHVTVPQFTWKVIIVLPQGTNDLSRVTTSTRVIAVIMPNSDSISGDWRTFRVSVDQVEALTGYDFFSNVPVAIQAVIESVVDNQP